MKKIHILIADDHKLMRMGLVSLFGVQKDMTVIGEAENGEAAVRCAAELKPDIVIMDLMMPKMNGADATSAILAANPAIGVIILSSYTDSFDMARAISNGARGAQAKEAPTENLIDAVRTVASGGTALAPDIMRCVRNNPPPPPQNPPREQPRQRTDEIARSIQNRVNQTASSLKAHVSSTPSSSVAGVVSAAQMSRYQAYMANSVTPKIRMLWNQHGPSGLDTIPRPAVITFYVEPSGRVNYYFISVKSDSAVVNQGAEALGKALTSQGLPPFSAANLVTEQNRPLTIQFTLDYQP